MGGGGGGGGGGPSLKGAVPGGDWGAPHTKTGGGGGRGKIKKIPRLAPFSVRGGNLVGLFWLGSVPEIQEKKKKLSGFFFWPVRRGKFYAKKPFWGGAGGGGGGASPKGGTPLILQRLGNLLPRVSTTFHFRQD